jgi:hypothetical protein
MHQAGIISTAPISAIHALRDLALPERLLGLYGYGIEGCAERSQEQVSAVLQELIGILNFDYGETAQGFHHLYTFCLAKARSGHFDQVARILGDLHDTWAQAFSSASMPEPLHAVLDSPYVAAPRASGPMARGVSPF